MRPRDSCHVCVPAHVPLSLRSLSASPATRRSRTRRSTRVRAGVCGATGSDLTGGPLQTRTYPLRCTRQHDAGVTLSCLVWRTSLVLRMFCVPLACDCLLPHVAYCSSCFVSRTFLLLRCAACSLRATGGLARFTRALEFQRSRRLTLRRAAFDAVRVSVTLFVSVIPVLSFSRHHSASVCQSFLISRLRPITLRRWPARTACGADAGSTGHC